MNIIIIIFFFFLFSTYGYIKNKWEEGASAPGSPTTPPVHEEPLPVTTTTSSPVGGVHVEPPTWTKGRLEARRDALGQQIASLDDRRLEQELEIPTIGNKKIRTHYEELLGNLISELTNKQLEVQVYFCSNTSCDARLWRASCQSRV